MNENCKCGQFKGLGATDIFNVESMVTHTVGACGFSGETELRARITELESALSVAEGTEEK